MSESELESGSEERLAMGLLRTLQEQWAIFDNQDVIMTVVLLRDGKWFLQEARRLLETDEDNLLKAAGSQQKKNVIAYTG